MNRKKLIERLEEVASYRYCPELESIIEELERSLQASETDRNAALEGKKKNLEVALAQINDLSRALKETESQLRMRTEERDSARQNYDKLVFHLNLADKAAQKWRDQFQAAEAEIERLNSEVLGRGEENLETLKRLDTEKKASQKYYHLLNERAFEVQVLKDGQDIQKNTIQDLEHRLERANARTRNVGILGILAISGLLLVLL